MNVTLLQLLSLGIFVSLLLIYVYTLIMQFPKGDVPEWVCNAMDVAGIDISSVGDRDTQAIIRTKNKQ